MSRDWSWLILFLIIAGLIWALVDDDSCGASSPEQYDQYGCQERESEQF